MKRSSKAAIGKVSADHSQTKGISTVAAKLTDPKPGQIAPPDDEAMFRRLAETTPAVIFLHQSGRVRYANSAAEALLGFTRDEWSRMNFWEAVHPDFRELVKKRGKARERGERVPPRYEFKLITKEGEERWVDLTATSIEFDGRPAVLGTAFDITDRKRAEQALHKEMIERTRAEEALRKSEQQLQAVLDNTTAVIYVKDLAGKYLLINRRYEVLFHITKARITGQTDYDLFPREMADTLRANDQKVIEAGMPVEFDEVVLHDDGIHNYISLKFPLYDLAGVPYAVCGISTDITKRKQDEQALRESEARYRALVENSPVGVWHITPEGYTIYANREMCSMLEIDGPEELAGKTYHCFGTPEALKTLERETAKRRVGIASSYEVEFIGKRGTKRSILASGAPLLSPEGKLQSMIGTLVDITERKRSEALQEGFSRRLLQTLEAERHRIARELHDDVGQSLAALGLQIHGLMEGKGNTRQNDGATLLEIEEALRQTTESVARLAREYHPAELSDLGVSSAIRSFARNFAKQHSLRLSLAVNSVGRHLSFEQELQLYRIVQEALHNIAKHAVASHVSLSVACGKESLRVTVKDNGKGFDPQLVARRSRGLGLITMRERAEILQGKLVVHAHPGKGTRIEVRVPLPSA